MIHPQALVDPAAKIGADVSIGPFSVIGPEVEIGSGTWIGPHVVIQGRTQIGCDNRIFQFSSIGEVPQDKKYANEPTRLIIGDRNVIREGATIHLGTVQDEGLTQIGHDNLFMANVHVAHDCRIGSHNILVNHAALAGHVHVGDHVIISGFCGVHQFCQIGSHAFLVHACTISMDVPPYVIVTGGATTTTKGINAEGLKRRGFSPEAIKGLWQAYKILYRQGLLLTQAMDELAVLNQSCPEVQILLDFLKNSRRGIVR